MASISQQAEATSSDQVLMWTFKFMSADLPRQHLCFVSKQTTQPLQSLDHTRYQQTAVYTPADTKEHTRCCKFDVNDP